MNTNLVAIDYSGLNLVLGEFRLHLAKLDKDIESNVRQDKHLAKETDNFKVSITTKFNDVSNQIIRLEDKYSRNGQKTSELEDLVVHLQNVVQNEMDKNAKQMEIDQGQDYKMLQLKREVETRTDKISKEFESLSKRITDSNHILDEQISKGLERIEPKLVEIKENVNGVENTITEILDRVESLENTAPLKAVSTPQQDTVHDSPMGVRSEGQDVQVGAYQVNSQKEANEKSVEFKILQQIKQAINEQVDISKSDLRKIVTEKMNLIVESEKLTNNSLTANQEGTETIQEEGANKAPKDELTHLPSLIEQQLNAHIRQIGDKAVFLQYVGPSGRRDGFYEIGTDISQIQSHMEVQTYNYENLNRSHFNSNQTMELMKFQIEEMTRKMQFMEKRIAAAEEVQSFDIAEDEPINTSVILEAIRNLKSEITLNTAKKDVVRDLTRTVEKLKDQVQPFDIITTETKFKDILSEIRGQMEAIPRDLQSIQLQLLRTDNSNFEASRQISDLKNCLSQREQESKAADELIYNLFQQSDSGKKLETKHIVQLVTKLREYVTDNFAKQESINKQDEKIIELQTAIEQIKSHQQVSHAKILEHSKQIRQQGGQFTKLMDEHTINKQWLKTLKSSISEKVDQDFHDNAMQEMEKAISTMFNHVPSTSAGTLAAGIPAPVIPVNSTSTGTLAAGIPASVIPVNSTSAGTLAAGIPAPLIPVRRKLPAKKAGPSKEVNNSQFKAALESISNLEDQIQNMQQQIKNFNLASLRDSIETTSKSLDQKANKSILEKSLVILEQDSKKVQQAMEKMRLEQEVTILNCSKQMTRVLENQQLKEIESKKMNEAMDRIEETIIALKRKNAGANARSALMDKNIAQLSHSLMDGNGNNQAEEMMGNVRQEFNDFKTQVERKNENYDYKLAMLMPLVGGDKGKNKDEKKLNAMEELELKLTEKLKKQDEAQVKIMQQLRQEFDVLDQAFKEKIKRQGLVQQHMRNYTNDNSDEELRKSLKKRKKTFLAEQMTRELVLNGRLPQFGMQGDHIARYGKGFSQMLNIASPQSMQEQLSHRQIHGSNSIDQMDGTISQEPSNPDFLKNVRQGSSYNNNAFGTIDEALKSALKTPILPTQEREIGNKTYILRHKKKNSVTVEISQEQSLDGGLGTQNGIWSGEKLPDINKRNQEEFTQARIHGQTK